MLTRHPLIADHHEDQPGCRHAEPPAQVHAEPEEGGLQDLHLGHQRQPGQHLETGRPSDRQPPPPHEDHRGATRDQALSWTNALCSYDEASSGLFRLAAGNRGPTKKSLKK